LSISIIVKGVISIAQDVAVAVLPLLFILFLLQTLYMKLPKIYVFNLLKGTLISSLGLWLFLLGTQIGFLPYGKIIGEALGSISLKWLAIPFGFLLGFITTWSEPAVHILCDQVEETSSHSIRSLTIRIAICIGVGVFVALAMARIVYNIPILYILIPGYILAILLCWLTQKQFIGIAFDSGGVATGPITNTYLLSIGIGMASSTIGGTSIINSLGLIALISLAPILSVMVLGVFIRIKLHRREKRP
jgi:hypothetical protein